MYCKVHSNLESAVKKERQLKNWHREWKINLIESKNNEWKDLYSDAADPIKILYSSNLEMLKQSAFGGQHEKT